MALPAEGFVGMLGTQTDSIAEFQSGVGDHGCLCVYNTTSFIGPKEMRFGCLLNVTFQVKGKFCQSKVLVRSKVHRKEVPESQNMSGHPF